MARTGAARYDGSDDALIGVVNDSGSVFTGSFVLTGSGNGGGIFAFDGDGICTYTGVAYCTTAMSGYQGPLNTLTPINAGKTSATGSFAGLGIADGATTYFSVESSGASSPSAGGIGLAMPEPGTLAIVGVGLAGLMGARRKRT